MNFNGLRYFSCAAPRCLGTNDSEIEFEVGANDRQSYVSLAPTHQALPLTGVQVVEFVPRLARHLLVVDLEVVQSVIGPGRSPIGPSCTHGIIRPVSIHREMLRWGFRWAKIKKSRAAARPWWRLAVLVVRRIFLVSAIGRLAQG